MVRRRRDQGDAGLGAAQPGDDLGDLAAGQLAALAGLGALGDLDLQDLGVDQVVRGDAETARGDLLDLGHLDRAITGRVFATLAGVRAAADAVHAFCQRLVRLWRQGAERHAGGVETFEDGLDRLHFGEVDRRRVFQPHQVAEHGRRPAVDQLGIAFVGRVVAGPNRRLQGLDHVRVVGVKLLAIHELEQAAGGDRPHRIEGSAVEPLLVGLEVFEGRAGNPRDRALQAHSHYIFVHPDHFEELRAAIAGDG